MILVRRLATLSLLALAAACEQGASTTAPAAATAASGVAPTLLSLTVDGTGYHPASIAAPPDRPVRLTITRTSDDGCGQQIVFPSLDIRRDLPLNKPVSVEFTMPASGTVNFTCGMDMLKGSIVGG